MLVRLVLEQGAVFEGESFGSTQDAIGQCVFNTNMVSIQEPLSDPSNSPLLLCMTYPLIGNHGITDDDYQSKSSSPKGLIVSEYNDKPSNFRATKTVKELCEENNITGITHVDTRAITRLLFQQGSQLGIITTKPIEEARQLLKSHVIKTDFVTCKKIYYSRTPNPKTNITIIDCGVRTSIIKLLNQHHCNVTIVPQTISIEKLMSLNSDGILISNGPGHPQDYTHVLDLIHQLKGKIPLMGISLGHQLLGLSCDGQIEPLKNGHRGSNHPVKDCGTNQIFYPDQNHGYVLTSVIGEITYHNMIDNSIEGFLNHWLMGIQFEPESKQILEFLEMMKAAQKAIDEVHPETLLIAVTQLTSTSQKQMNSDLLIEGALEDVVVHYAQNAQRAGLAGVVCSPLEARMIKENTNNHFITVTPGIRFSSSVKDDQKRITTPALAKEIGSDYIVVGRPITQADNPVEVYLTCVKEFCDE